MNAPPFVGFPPITRLSRDCIITEKIDGTNAVIHVADDVVYAGSRNRWITPEADNHGFAAWVRDRAEELWTGLGDGTHYGEWWGGGINKRYPGYTKQFHLFNTLRWNDGPPACLGVVPVLYRGLFRTDVVDRVCDALRRSGSLVAPGCPAEGVIIMHVPSRALFKKTLSGDESKTVSMIKTIPYVDMPQHTGGLVAPVFEMEPEVR